MLKQMTLSKLARDPDWNCVVDVKDFDATQTSIVRVFEHTSGFGYVFCQHSTDGKIDGMAIEPVSGNSADSVRASATKAKVSNKAISDAVALLP
jgi:hypothetical protein